MRVRRFGWAALAAAALLAQGSPAPSPEARLTLIPFHVAQRGPDATRLTAEDILLTEDGAPRKISFFSGPASERDTAFDFDAGSAMASMPVELVVLLNTTGGPALDWVPILQRRPQPPQPTFGRPDPVPAFAAWLKDAFLDRVTGSRIAVYGFDSNLQRYCRGARDSKVVLAAIRGAVKRAKGEALVLGRPLETGGTPRTAMRWDAAIAAVVQDAAGEAEDSNRFMLALLRGLPADDSRPLALAAVCRDFGMTTYPLFRELVWPGYARRTNSAPATPEWRRMNKAQRAAWLDEKEREFVEFNKLGPATGGLADPGDRRRLEPIADDIELQVRWAYTAGFTHAAVSGEPRAHRVEARLRDGRPGVVEGGKRTAVY